MRLQACLATSRFHMGTKNSSSRPHVSMAGTVPTRRAISPVSFPVTAYTDEVLLLSFKIDLALVYISYILKTITPHLTAETSIKVPESTILACSQSKRVMWFELRSIKCPKSSLPYSVSKEYFSNFSSELTMFSPRTKDHLIKTPTPGMKEVIGQGCLRDLFMADYYYCPCLTSRGWRWVSIVEDTVYFRRRVHRTLIWNWSENLLPKNQLSWTRRHHASLQRREPTNSTAQL